uniref:Uncharacterized protein n=1 Tax=Grammatophora oceanica TaxID=210454 RepID=A0A7S1UYY5_9STRA|mmetsp:Transcript_27456/g.40320  ORF Transcript_27456/g.40320 Transcript_27456/m.40320 type:complete len:248 (+) Transcript_27456:82-825(+)|eukprot:CAMPEP_0194046526 /NCGR_PEP_ID=MMETSP0009_2-20130614/21465_1 /TAXON_ID=210454 /ORGANISM="Grammatophora oceanica, Strain CCMP 410" /LENGTH=247 /DNA_ID=CAMNT_0038691853 /DNA_START=53 /DNA_END=796 /DNA_ORIENTATION=+
MPSIRFNETVDVLAEIKPASEMSEKEHQRLWFQPPEFDKMRLDAHRLATAIRHCHKMDPSNQLSYTNSFASVYETCQRSSNPDAEMMRRLVHWVHAGPNRRGLEKYSMEFMQQQRMKNKSRHSQTLLRLQQAMWDYGMPDEEVAETLARSSIKSAKRDRLFALTMACADRRCIELDRELEESKDFSEEQKERKERKERKDKKQKKKQYIEKYGDKKPTLAASEMSDKDSLRGIRVHRATKSRRVLAQ